MTIPDIIKRKNLTFYLYKTYNNFVRYKSNKGFYECFSLYELKQFTETEKPPKQPKRWINIHPERVKA